MTESARRPDGALIGLAVAFFILAGSQNEARPLVQYALTLGLPVVLIATFLTARGWMGIVYLVITGITIRIAILDLVKQALQTGFYGSDVLPVTDEALDVLLHGHNPYAHAYTVSTNPYAYPPGNLLYYLPGHLLGDIRATEVFSAAVVLIGLAAVCWFIRSDWPAAAIGLYASAQTLLILSTDGSNDTSAGALLFVSAIVLFVSQRQGSPILLICAALLMGETLAFKQYALPFWPVFIGYLAQTSDKIPVALFERRVHLPAWSLYAAISAAFAGVISLPFFVWSPADFYDGLTAWSSATIHPIEGWNVWAFLLRWQGWNAQEELGDTLVVIDAGVMAATVAAGLLLGVGRASRALFFGVAAWFALMLFARWTTWAYFPGVAPVVLLIPFADSLARAPEDQEWESGKETAPVALPT